MTIFDLPFSLFTAVVEAYATLVLVVAKISIKYNGLNFAGCRRKVCCVCNEVYETCYTVLNSLGCTVLKCNILIEVTTKPDTVGEVDSHVYRYLCTVLKNEFDDLCIHGDLLSLRDGYAINKVLDNVVTKYRKCYRCVLDL